MVFEPLVGRFLIYDALRMRFRELKLRKDPDCPVCGTHPTVTKLIDYEQFCGLHPQAQDTQTTGASVNEWEITATDLKRTFVAVREVLEEIGGKPVSVIRRRRPSR